MQGEPETGAGMWECILEATMGMICSVLSPLDANAEQIVKDRIVEGIESKWAASLSPLKLLPGQLVCGF